ncbi:putative acetyltransferase [Novosphingobium nitrogenifigens DSM 19370]|uniref:Putative acetyltransferase n=1 Tax=Novosphingobium nitrogenifigens DSM 19370 TaxID=983920 RepID=F1Z6L8_9SPHN|nr:GNAT family acetyltransferase [Novosphingobium nitrogenifigens]EGD59678.1 putative acetyltransferase [Novosphingobium nitrogenifigens DSM 19370]
MPDMTQTTISIRTAQDADAPAVIALWQAAGLTRPWNDPATDYALALAHPMARVLIADDRGRDGHSPVGTIMAGYDGHRGWFYYLGVAPTAQRQGIGRMLVRAAEAWLTSVGCPKAMLMVRSDNAAVTAFYTALGYEAQAVTTLGRRLDGR